jgi:hypothetical protein
MTTTNNLPSTLSRKILANKFDEAQELIDQGVSLTNGLISTAIWRDKFEAFKFLFNHGKDTEISDYDLYSVFMNSDEINSNKFRNFFIANKDNNIELQKLFSNSEYQFETFFEEANKKLGKIHIAYINPEAKFSYNLQLEMTIVIDIKEGVNTLIKKIDEFSEFKKHLAPTSIENELMFEEIQRKATKYQDIYNNYLADRLNLREQLKPLNEEREKLNNRIAETLKKFADTNSSNKIKPK